MKERIIFGFDPFVIPFTLGMVFIILYLLTGTTRIVLSLNNSERVSLFKSLFSRSLFKSIKEIFTDVLLHIKIFKRNALLGYMHSSIAFGWFMLIFIGHLEVMLYTPHRNGVLYYPVFFRFFVMETNETLRGAFFFFLMDLFLLIVLTGVSLAIYKRFRSIKLGMKRTSKHKPGDKIAMIALWMVFPLRLIAESFTADISGGSFLTKGVNKILFSFVSNHDYMLPVWWAYSSVLAIFLFALPFSRYMHIPTEILLIFLRNAGIKSTSSRDGFAETEIYSCSSCGICIDACPMLSVEEKSKYTTVYLIRLLRRRKSESLEAVNQCLMCRKCVELCPVQIDSCRLKLLKKEEVFQNGVFNHNYRKDEFEKKEQSVNIKEQDGIIYYAGCMTHLTPAIYTSFIKILKRANIPYLFADEDGSVCCGRPLILSGGESSAKALIRENTALIESCKYKTLVLSCPICLKVFKENYELKDVRIIHHSEYIDELISKKVIEVEMSDMSAIYHDPCDLGRGCLVYDAPRRALSKVVALQTIDSEKRESICCGGSLASRKFSYTEKRKVASDSLNTLIAMDPDLLITSCPLCLKTFSSVNRKETLDIAQLIEKQMIKH